MSHMNSLPAARAAAAEPRQNLDDQEHAQPFTDHNDVYFELTDGTRGGGEGAMRKCVESTRFGCLSCLNLATTELGLAAHPFSVLAEAVLLLVLLSGERVLLVYAMQHALVNRINQDFRYMLFLFICALHTGVALCVAAWRTIRGRSNWVAAWSFPKSRLVLIVLLRFAHLVLFTVPVAGVPAQATVVLAQSAIPFTMLLMTCTRGAKYSSRQILGAALVAVAIVINTAPLLQSTLKHMSSSGRVAAALLVEDMNDIGGGIISGTEGTEVNITSAANLLLPVQCLGFDGDCAADVIMYIASGAVAACTTVFFESSLGSSPHPVPPEMLDSLLLPMQLLLGAIFTPVGGLVQEPLDPWRNVTNIVDNFQDGVQCVVLGQVDSQVTLESMSNLEWCQPVLVIAACLVASHFAASMVTTDLLQRGGATTTGPAEVGSLVVSWIILASTANALSPWPVPDNIRVADPSQREGLHWFDLIALMLLVVGMTLHCRDPPPMSEAITPIYLDPDLVELGNRAREDADEERRRNNQRDADNNEDDDEALGFHPWRDLETDLAAHRRLLNEQHDATSAAGARRQGEEEIEDDVHHSNFPREANVGMPFMAGIGSTRSRND